MKQKERLYKEDGADKVDKGYYRSLIRCLIYLSTTGQIFYLMQVFYLNLCILSVNCIRAEKEKNFKIHLRYYGVKFEKCQNFQVTRILE